ncbi:MAG: hypothetical protein AB7I19_09880 [Planctomycetota bacterium]
MIRTKLLSALLPLAALATLSAQSTLPVHFPQSGTDGSNGNIIPFGFSTSSTNFDEGRWQILIPARYLPSSGGLAFGLDVLSQATLSATYASLDLTLSTLPAGSSLSTDFATNLPAPQLVFSHTNYTIAWQAQTWQTIPFDVPFIYDGTSDVVVQIQKTYDRVANPPPGLGHHQTDGNPGRSDLPLNRYAFGNLGSGAVNATTATSATRSLKVGLRFATAGTLTIDGRRNSFANGFSLGNNFDVTLHGPAGTPFGALVSVGYAAQPTSIPGIGGLIYIDIVFATAYSSGVLGTSGTSTLNWTVPNSPALVGLNLAFQGVVGGASLQMTNTVDCIINS